MSSRSNLRGRRRTRNQGVQKRNESSENVNVLNDVEMEYGDVVDKKKIEAGHVEEWDTKQGIGCQRKKKDRLLKSDLTHHKTENINSGRLNGENSCNDTSRNNVKKGTPLKKKPVLSNGLTDVESDVCSMEENKLHESCTRKRKRCTCDCDNYNSKGSGLRCIGILPGVKSIIESSDDSDQSCSSDSEGNENNKYDLLGRKILYVAKKSSDSK